MNRSRIARVRLSLWFFVWGVLFFGILESCSKSGGEAGVGKQTKAEILQNGERIILPESSPDDSLFKTQSVSRSALQVEVIAPARAVASVSRPLSGEDGGIILFDTPDATSLYSNFIQNSAALAKARKNLDRVKELFSKELAAAKDVSDAEADLATANAALGESEGKIRAAGLNPQSFRSAQPGTIWLISDVPETQLYEVQQGEITTVEFSSFPSQPFKGTVEAIGEVIDNATRTVKVRIAVANAQGRVKPGMFAKVNFGKREANMISIPQRSAVSVLGKNFVFVRTKDREYSRREVQIGRQAGDRLIVINGLQEGERIVVEGALLLKGLSFGY